MFKPVHVHLLGSAMLATMLSVSAAAELPAHPQVAGFGPTEEEVFPDGETQGPRSVSFGESVAIRDSYAMAGMPDRGEVAVYARTASSGWQRTTVLKPSDGGSFGRALAMKDNIAVVGGREAAYVFRRDSGVWREISRLVPPAQDQVRDFSRAIRYQDGRIVVSGRDSQGGVVYVFEINRSTGAVIRHIRLRPADVDPESGFGASIGMTHDTIVVGAPTALRGDARSGAAYVFRLSNGQWIQRQTLFSSDAGAHDQFGAAVAIDRQMIVVGASNHNSVGNYFGTSHDYYASGAAYVFVPVNGQYVQKQKLRPTPEQHASYIEFGSEVAMFDKFIVVSAHATDALGISYSPAGYGFSYLRDGNTLTARGIAHVPVYSSSVYIANNWLLMGSGTDHRCYFGACIGGADLFDLNRLRR